VQGGNFGNLAGADQLCQDLATAVGAGARTWRAFLSTDAVDARTRIGNGPWTDANGALIAQSLTALFTDGLPPAQRNLTDENGTVLPSNIHDVVTGSGPDGNRVAGQNCNGWTSNLATATTIVGHSNGAGPQVGIDNADPNFGWIRAHPAPGTTPCDQPGLASGGGDGRIYCFAAD
jgi:hypothetical protein